MGKNSIAEIAMCSGLTEDKIRELKSKQNE